MSGTTVGRLSCNSFPDMASTWRSLGSLHSRPAGTKCHMSESHLRGIVLDRSPVQQPAQALCSLSCCPNHPFLSDARTPPTLEPLELGKAATQAAEARFKFCTCTAAQRSSISFFLARLGLQSIPNPGHRTPITQLSQAVTHVATTCMTVAPMPPNQLWKTSPTKRLLCHMGPSV